MAGATSSRCLSDRIALIPLSITEENIPSLPEQKEQQKEQIEPLAPEEHLALTNEEIDIAELPVEQRRVEARYFYCSLLDSYVEDYVQFEQNPTAARPVPFKLSMGKSDQSSM